MFVHQNVSADIPKIRSVEHHRFQFMETFEFVHEGARVERPTRKRFWR